MDQNKIISLENLRSKKTIQRPNANVSKSENEEFSKLTKEQRAYFNEGSLKICLDFGCSRHEIREHSNKNRNSLGENLYKHPGDSKEQIIDHTLESIEDNHGYELAKKNRRSVETRSK